MNMTPPIPRYLEDFRESYADCFVLLDLFVSFFFVAIDIKTVDFKFVPIEDRGRRSHYRSQC